MSQPLTEIERALAEALEQEDEQVLSRIGKSFEKFVYGFAYNFLRKQGDFNAAEDAEDVVGETWIEIDRTIRSGRLQLRRGRLQAQSAKGEWYPFAKWLGGVIRMVCRRILRGKKPTISLEEPIDEDKEGRPLTLPDVLPRWDVGPVILAKAKDRLCEWIAGLATSLLEYAETLNRGRLQEVACALSRFLCWKVAQFICPPLSGEQWREMDVRELLGQANLVDLGKDLLTEDYRLAFNTTEVWDWIQQELNLTRANRDQLKSRFTKTLRENNPDLLASLQQAGLL